VTSAGPCTLCAAHQLRGLGAAPIMPRKDLQSTLETCTAYPPELSRFWAPTCHHNPATPQTFADYNSIHDAGFGWRCKAKF
jgi:hypothetical protein